MKSCVLANCLKNRSLSCDHAPEWIRDSEGGHHLSPFQASVFALDILWFEHRAPLALSSRLHDLILLVNVYHSQRKCGFTPAAKARLLWSPRLPLPGGWTPCRAFLCPSLMAPSKVQSPQGLEWLEWDIASGSSRERNARCGAKGVKHPLQPLCLRRFLI